MRKIVTHHSFPPIPTNKFDWCAFYDGEEEAGCYGYGATEEEAIADFVENAEVAYGLETGLGDHAKVDNLLAAIRSATGDDR